MPRVKFDKNFIVVSVILGGLLVWSLVRTPEKPEPQQTFYIMPGDDRQYAIEGDEPDDAEMAEKEKMPGRDATAQAIMGYIASMNNQIMGYRQEVDQIFLGDQQPWRNTTDLERDAPQWLEAFNNLYALCARLGDEFKLLQQRLTNDFGEGAWVAANMNLLQFPVEVRLVLDGYKKGSTYQQVYIASMNVVSANRPQTQNEYQGLNTNQQFNERGDDYPRGSGTGTDKDVFMGTASQQDPVTMDKATVWLRDTSSNPQPGTGGSGQQTLANDDEAFNTLNSDGRLGGGNMGDRADDTDMRDQDKIAKAAATDTASAKASLSSGFATAQTSSQKPTLPSHPYQNAPNDQLQRSIDAIGRQQAEIASAVLKLAASKKEETAKDNDQNLPVKDAGTIPKGTPVDAAATYHEPAADASEVNETDAAPAKPEPLPIAPATVPSTSKPTQIAGRKTKREEFDYVALNTGPDPKKAKQTTQEAVVPPPPSPEPEPETGTKRESGEPETRKDVTEQDAGAPERPGYKGDVGKPDPLRGGND